MILGFTAGRYKNEKYFLRKLDFFLKIGCNALELHPLVECPTDFNLSKKVINYLHSFPYVSLHAPARNFQYDNSPSAKNVYSVIDDWINKLNIKTVVIHPDKITYPEILLSKAWPYALENMDSTKKDGRTIDQISKWFERISNANMVLDLNHIFTNDETMNITEKFTGKFKDKITEIHISGYLNTEMNHEPLTLSDCQHLRNYIFDKTLPVIMEVSVDNLPKPLLQKEFYYLKEFLES
jgi:hypothetical protein